MFRAWGKEERKKTDPRPTLKKVAGLLQASYLRIGVKERRDNRQPQPDDTDVIGFLMPGRFVSVRPAGSLVGPNKQSNNFALNLSLEGIPVACLKITDV